jgi:hypothetical protein
VSFEINFIIVDEEEIKKRLELQKQTEIDVQKQKGWLSVKFCKK